MKTKSAPAAKRNRNGKRGKLDPAVLADLVARVVRAAQPEKIVLFGSAARGEMGPNSDVDLLVIKPGKYDRDRVTAAIYRELSGADAPVDAVVVTPEDVGDIGTHTAWSSAQRCVKGRSSMAIKRFPPTDPREWLRRARSNLALCQRVSPEVDLEDSVSTPNKRPRRRSAGAVIALMNLPKLLLSDGS